MQTPETDSEPAGRDKARGKARDIVLVGGSKGAMQALRRLVQSLPASLPAAVIVVLQPHEHHSTQFADDLRSLAAMPVLSVAGAEAPRPGSIYIAPPGGRLVVRPPGTLDAPRKDEGHDLESVNLLFRSAAQVFRERVVGVVLSGLDGDGANGLRAIKAQGGLSVVQSPSDAIEPGMPSHAILHDDPDYIVFTDQLSMLLVGLASGKASPLA